MNIYMFFYLVFFFAHNLYSFLFKKKDFMEQDMYSVKYLATSTRPKLHLMKSLCNACVWVEKIKLIGQREFELRRLLDQFRGKNKNMT